MISINVNSAASGAGLNLGKSNDALQKSLSRLSSGRRIVTSSDDAGGLAVSMKINAALHGMNRGDRLQTDRGHGLHIDWGLCPGKMSYQWNRNNDLLIWRKAVGLR